MTWPELGDLPELAFMNKPPETWGARDVQAWLRGVGMTSYQEEFEGISGSELLELDEEALLKIGVERRSHRAYFGKLINCLAQSSFFFDNAFTEPTGDTLPVLENTHTSEMPWNSFCPTNEIEGTEAEGEEGEGEEDEDEEEEEEEEEEELLSMIQLIRSAQEGEQQPRFLSLSAGTTFQDLKQKLHGISGREKKEGEGESKRKKRERKKKEKKKGKGKEEKKKKKTGLGLIPKRETCPSRRRTSEEGQKKGRKRSLRTVTNSTFTKWLSEGRTPRDLQGQIIV